MRAGALVAARVERLVFGTPDLRFGGKDRPCYGYHTAFLSSAGGLLPPVLLRAAPARLPARAGHARPLRSLVLTRVMCAGALVAARVERVVFGTRDLRFGGVRSKFRIADSGTLNHTVEIVEGVLAVECVELLREFFEERR